MEKGGNVNISILCRYPVIHEGIKSLLKDNFENISYFSSMDNCIKSLNSTDDKSINNTKDTLLIITLFKEDLEIIDNILSIKDNYSNLKLLGIALIILITNNTIIILSINSVNIWVINILGTNPKPIFFK